MASQFTHLIPPTNRQLYGFLRPEKSPYDGEIGCEKMAIMLYIKRNETVAHPYYRA